MSTLICRFNYESFDFNYLMSVRLVLPEVKISNYINYINYETLENPIIKFHND